jgi:hypothetical protein
MLGWMCTSSRLLRGHAVHIAVKKKCLDKRNEANNHKDK